MKHYTLKGKPHETLHIAIQVAREYCTLQDKISCMKHQTETEFYFLQWLQYNNPFYNFSRNFHHLSLSFRQVVRRVAKYNNPS